MRNNFKKLNKRLDEREEEIERLNKKCDRLLHLARKMHLWIFLNSDDEQAVYDEIGITREENVMLGYSGQMKIKDKYVEEIK